MCSRPKISTGPEHVVRPAGDLKIVGRRRSPERRRLDVIQLELPLAVAAAPIRRGPRAAAAVAFPHLPADRERDGSRVEGLRCGALDRARRALPLRLHRPLPLPMFRDGAADGLADHRRELPVRRVAEERRELVELRLAGVVDSRANRSSANEIPDGFTDRQMPSPAGAPAPPAPPATAKPPAAPRAPVSRFTVPLPARGYASPAAPLAADPCSPRAETSPSR